MNSNRNAQLILYKARQSVRRRCRRRRGSVAQLLALFAAFRVSFFWCLPRIRSLCLCSVSELV